ncbi:MAG: mycofactocin system glycosyltransferase [Pelotomaculum sp.]|nr:mycofactocin system glycosyltransferase [Pelotomaculum sp.]
MIRYRLAEGVTLHENGNLAVRRPARIIRLTPGGVKVLRQICGDGLGPELQGGKAAAFAAWLEEQGLLEKIFPTLPEELLPFVSVVVPTRNRQDVLVSCVESLLDVDYPADKLEIIVVDDASDPPVALEGYRRRVKSIRLDENRGPGAARNEAAKLARGEIIAFIDDDCLAGRGWLKDLVPCFQYRDVAAAGGMVEPAGLTRLLEKYERCQSPLSMGKVQRKAAKNTAVSYLPACNLLVRKDLFAAAGGFDPALRVGEDVDLCWRLLEKGGQIYYIPGGAVYHRHRAGLLPFLKRRYDYGRSEALLRKKHPQDKKKHVCFPGSGFVLAAALAWFLAGAPAALAALSGLAALNLFLQSFCRFKGIRRAGGALGFGGVLKAAARSQGAAVYLCSRRFARYRSIPALAASLLVFPGLAPFFLAFHMLPGFVDFVLKKPGLNLFCFVFYHTLEDFAYQAGVIAGINISKLSNNIKKFQKEDPGNGIERTQPVKGPH